MNETDDNSSYGPCEFGECYLKQFSETYDKIHIPLSIAVCLFGTFSNVANIIVLTHKQMRTPINMLLTGLSIAQLLLAANYFGLLTVEYFRMRCHQLPWSLHVAWYRLINVNLNVVFHTTAFAHTIVVAIFRFAAIRWPIKANRYIYRCELAVMASAMTWFIVPLICTPVFLSSQVGQLAYDYTNCSLEEMYDLNYSRQSIIIAAFWMFGIVLKLFPSVLLTAVIIGLIHSLKSVDRRRSNLQPAIGSSDSATPSAVDVHSIVARTKSQKKRRRTAARPRTTRMLVIVLLLCVLVEFPHGVLNLFTGIYGADFGLRVYDHLGSFMEMLTLLYSSINFVLYCTMSNDFLRTFRKLFCPCVPTQLTEDKALLSIGMQGHRRFNVKGALNGHQDTEARLSLLRTDSNTVAVERPVTTQQKCPTISSAQ